MRRCGGLGCGSAAKPVLRGLERNPKVKEARINYPGTVLAIAWKEPAQAPSSVAAVETSFKEWELEAELLQGSERDKALKEYETGRWYRAADVDRLSEREAEVIASRLVNRAKPHLGLSPERLTSLTKELSAGIAQVLTRDRGEEAPWIRMRS